MAKREGILINFTINYQPLIGNISIKNWNSVRVSWRVYWKNFAKNGKFCHATLSFSDQFLTCDHNTKDSSTQFLLCHSCSQYKTFSGRFNYLVMFFSFSIASISSGSLGG
jgi:hypothetical protein